MDFLVIPVKAKIQLAFKFQNINWIPAFAGMTEGAVALFVGIAVYSLKKLL